MIRSEEFGEVKNFLAATFRQDIKDWMEELREYIGDSDSEWLTYMSNEIEHFLKSEFPESDKEKFIQEYSYIYYPAIGFKPLEWLTYVLEEMKRSI